LNANKESYAVTGLEKGVNGISFFYGVILVIVILCLVTALSCYPFYKKDAALLISGADTRRENKIIANFANFCANLTPKRYRLSVRIAMRKPVTILLTVAAVGTVSTLFILSGSLNMSSQKVYSSQTDGHHYQYETQYDTYQEGANTANGDGEVYYLHEPIAIALDNNQENIQQQIIGMDSPSAC
jgi:putative ABC transport system permease protein